MKLNRFKFKIATMLAFILISTETHANSLEDFYKEFKGGHYPQALLSLEKVTDLESQKGMKSYLKGLSLSRMQEYDKASIAFEQAIKEKNSSSDLYYEYGQSLYASNELKKAREAFKFSADKNFNKPASLYYVAHISQILEEFDMAREYYAQVIKEKSSDTKMKQISYFQLSETLLSIARNKSTEPADLSRRVEKFILPLLTTAYNQDKSSTVAAEINQRSAEIMVEFNLDPNLLVNGRRISPKRYSGYVSQKIRFDNNISLTNEENNTQQSKKESYIFETEAYANYDFVVNKRYLISPEVRLNFIEHGDQSTPEVYQNDSFSMNFNLKNKFEHKLFDAPASLIFDIDYARTLKDWKAQKKRDFYADSVTFTLGESFSYFSIGDTTVKIKRKNYKGENTAISNHTTTLTADQTFFFPTQHLLIALFDASFIDNFNNKTTNTNTYLLRFDYIVPQIMPQYTVDFALGTTITDTKEQKASRGTEISWNPSVDLSRDLSSSSKIGINYDFTKNKSKDANYSYNKQVFTTEFRYSF